MSGGFYVLFFYYGYIDYRLERLKLILGKEQLILAEVIGVLQAIAAAGEAVLLVVLNFILPVLFQKKKRPACSTRQSGPSFS